MAREETASILDKGRFALSEARTLSDVSRSRARAILEEQRSLVERALEKPRPGSASAVLSSLRDDLAAASDDIGLIHRNIPETYLHTSLLREGTIGSSLVDGKDQLLVVDRDRRVVFSVDPKQRSGLVRAAAAQLADARSVAGNEAGVFALTNTSVVDVGADPPKDVITDEEQTWGEPIKIMMYSDNVYVIDRGRSEVYRYSDTGEEFGERDRWFAPGITPDLSQLVDAAIDGSVWFLFKDGSVRQYVHGTPTSFRHEPFDDAVDPAFLSVPQDGTRVWVLDRGAGRITAYDRETGEYAGQWVTDAARDALGFVVNEEAGRIFFLIREQVLFLPIE